MTDTTHEAPDLLPCPFCGGVAKYYHRSDTTGWSNTEWVKYYHRPDTTGWSNTEWVSCSGECGASTCMHETKEGAIAAWNTRSDDLVQAADRIEELEAKLAKAAGALEKAGCTYAANDARLIHSETQVRDICRATLAELKGKGDE